MKLRVAVAAGEFSEYFVGTGGATSAPGGAVERPLLDANGRLVPGRMVHFLAGPAIAEAGDALGVIKPGEVAVCGSALRWLPPGAVLPAAPAARAAHCAPRPAPDSEEPSAPASARGLPRQGSFEAGPENLQVAHPSVKEALGDFAARCSGSALSSRRGSVVAAAAPPEELTPAEEEAVALYVPYTVRARLEEMRDWAAGSGAGASAFDPTRLLSEFRVTSVLFASLEGMRALAGDVQRAARTLQAALYAHEGSLHQLVRDDKGLVFIGVFGLWPVAHEDDAPRAVACALALRRAMAGQGVAAHVGITTGLVFSTFVGCPERCSFSVFGTVVNRAARLMAKSCGEVFVDQRTHEAARARFRFEHAGDFALKGVDGKVPVFKVVAPSDPAEAAALQLAPREPSRKGAPEEEEVIIGRAGETARVEALAESLAAGPAGGIPTLGGERPPAVLFLEGPAGSGKGTLCARALRLAGEAGAAAAVAAGLESRARQAFFLWRAVVRALFPGGLAEMARLLGGDEADVALLPALAQALQLERDRLAPADSYAPKSLLMGDAFAVESTPIQPFAPNGDAAAPRASERAPEAERPKAVQWVQGPLGDGPAPASLEPAASNGNGNGNGETPGRPAAEGAAAGGGGGGKGAAAARWKALRGRLLTQGADAAAAAPAVAADADKAVKAVDARAPEPTNGAPPEHAAAAPGGGFPLFKRGGTWNSVLKQLKVAPNRNRLREEGTANALRALIAKLVVRRAETGGPVLIVLKDMHYADSQSWGTLAALAERLAGAGPRRAAVLATSRPLAPGTVAAKLAAALQRDAARCETLPLGPMSEEEVELLVCAAVRGERLPRVLRDFIVAQSESLPSVAVDLARSLLDDGTIEVDGEGEVHVRKALRKVKPSDAARASLVAKLDRLTPGQAMTLKLASVAGVRFSARELLAMHPQEAQVERDVAALVRQGHLGHVLAHHHGGAEGGGRGSPGHDGDEYEFRQPAMQEVVYSLMPVTERRALHLTLAAFHEARLKERGPKGGAEGHEEEGEAEEEALGEEAASVLAHHFAAAGEPERARPHLEVCAAAAYAAHADLEAARLYEDLVRLYPSAPALMRARWFRFRADLSARMEMHKEAVELALRGLEVLGRPVPSSRLLQRASVSWRLFRFSLLGPRRPPPAPASAAAATAAASRSERDGEAFLLLNAMTFSAYSTARGALDGPPRPPASRPPRAPPGPADADADAQVYGMLGRREAVARWAAAAEAAASEADSPPAWDALATFLGDALVRSAEPEAASEALAAWADVCAGHRTKNRLVMVCLYRVVLALRASASVASPGGVPALLAELQAVLDAAAKDSELLDDLHLTLGHAAGAALRLLLGDPAAACGLLEAHLARGRSVPQSSPPLYCILGAVHAEALLRSAGPAARACDGRPAARVALDAAAAAAAAGGARRAVGLASDFAPGPSSLSTSPCWPPLLLLPYHPLALPASLLLPACLPPPGEPSPARPAALAAAAPALRRSSLAMGAAEHAPAAPPTEAELRVGLLAACRRLERAGARDARALRRTAAGLARAAEGRPEAAAALFARAAREAAGAREARGAALALALQAAHTRGAARRGPLLAAARAAAEAAGDAALARAAARMAELSPAAPL
eukprot:tig00000545_g2012.t1